MYVIVICMYVIVIVVAKHCDPGRKADAHLKLFIHGQSVDFAKVLSGEKRSLLDTMTEQAITEKAKKEGIEMYTLKNT